MEQFAQMKRSNIPTTVLMPKIAIKKYSHCFINRINTLYRCLLSSRQCFDRNDESDEMKCERLNISIRMIERKKIDSNRGFSPPWP